MAQKRIPYVGKCFPTIEGFMDYLHSIPWKSWRPAYVTMHHTGGPDLATWRGYSQRSRPITDEEWMGNLAAYYANSAYDARGKLIKGAWTSGPQFFATPKNYCVLSLPWAPGVHAASFNANSWGIECVGNFDKGYDKLTPELLTRYAAGIAALHVAMGFQPDPYRFKVRGLHFHRDDPLTKKTCPGSSILKPTMVKAVREAMESLIGGTSIPAGQQQAAPIVEAKTLPKRMTGTVVNVAAGDTLFIRAGAGQFSPKIGELAPGASMIITGSAMNANTKWWSIDIPGDADGWVSGNFVKAA